MALPGTSWHYATEPSFPNSSTRSASYAISRTASEAGGRGEDTLPRSRPTQWQALGELRGEDTHASLARESRSGHHLFQVPSGLSDFPAPILRLRAGSASTKNTEPVMSRQEGSGTASTMSSLLSRSGLRLSDRAMPRRRRDFILRSSMKVPESGQALMLAFGGGFLDIFARRRV